MKFGRQEWYGHRLSPECIRHNVGSGPKAVFYHRMGTLARLGLHARQDRATSVFGNEPICPSEVQNAGQIEAWDTDGLVELGPLGLSCCEGLQWDGQCGKMGRRIVIQ
jgi:hypothetical protein